MLTSARISLGFLVGATLFCSGYAAAQEPPPPSIREALKYEGRRIVSIEFDPPDQPLEKEQLRSRLVLHPGAAFEELELRQTIQNLFATGRYSDLAVDATEARGGIALRFLTQRASFVGRVLVTGVRQQPPNNGQLASATKLRLGAPYAEADRRQATESLNYLLGQNGFYHFRVDSKVEFEPETERVNVIFYITTGKRARFTEPSITGNPGFPTERLIRATHWKRLYGLLGWQQVTGARVQQGVDNLRNFYEKNDRLQSKVALTGLDHADATNTVKPTLDLQAGPKIVVAVDGARVSHGRLRELVPAFQEGSIDADLLLEGQRNLKEYLETVGYFGALVSYKVDNGANSRERTVTYSVNRGSRHRFVSLSIKGNRYFSQQTIRERLYIQPAQFPRFPFGRYSSVYLKQDLQAIENLYSTNGFRDVELTSKTLDDYNGVKDHIAVTVTIQEGQQWFVSHLGIEGAEPADLAVLRSRITSIPGQPFSVSNVASDRDTFLNYYYGRGYVNATFDYYQDLSSEQHRANLRYVVHPGERRYVRDVLVSGLETTRAKLVNGRISLHKGDPLSLTQETDSQRRLYDLGIFARVNTALQDPDGDEEDKYVLYDIDEARHYSLNVGVGAQIARIGGGVTSLDNPAGTTGFAPRLAVGVSRINLFGLAQTIGVQTAVSTIEQRAALTYFVPQFISHNNLSFTATALIENSNDIRTFTANRREGSIQVGQRLSRAYTAQYRLIFRNITLSNLKIDQLLVPLLSQPEVLGLGEISLIQDKRDDPADAHRGIYTTVDLSYAPKFLGSQTQFGRVLLRNSTYYQLRRDVVFARSTQFGLITRTGGQPLIPLAERIYSGGSTSLRSFPDFQAGPRDLLTGFPLGGNALFINNLELRFPLYGDNVGGVLFEDAGNVYSSLGAVSFRFRQENLQNFNYMVQSAGFGIRYRTPIGPVRLDLSFSPNAPRFFGLKGTLQNLIDGTAISTVQKINAFQFHFSLGQAF